MKIRIVVVLILLACVASAFAAPPKVVFIGDYIPYN
jgi:hypothetical protein